MSQDCIDRAVAALQAGGILAHYTDTVVGLATLPHEKQLLRLTRIKNRHYKQGYIFLASSTQQLAHLVDCDLDELEDANNATTVPTTWLLKVRKNTPTFLSSTEKKVAIRISANSQIKKITKQVGMIASTSANVSGQRTVLSPRQAYQQLGPQIDYIMPTENLGSNLPSTIIDFYSREILRK